MKVLALYDGDSFLAEVRTDGRNFELFDDATNNGLTQEYGNDYIKLRRAVETSSRLVFKPVSKEIQRHRYLMDDGSVVEAAVDGRSVSLNGRLLMRDERDAMLAAIRNGQLSVMSKDIVPTGSRMVDGIANQGVASMDKRMSDAAKQYNARIQEILDSGSIHYDAHIEDADYEGLERPAVVKNMMYILRYGGPRGGRA